VYTRAGGIGTLIGGQETRRCGANTASPVYEKYTPGEKPESPLLRVQGGHITRGLVRKRTGENVTIIKGGRRRAYLEG